MRVFFAIPGAKVLHNSIGNTNIAARFREVYLKRGHKFLLSSAG